MPRTTVRTARLVLMLFFATLSFAAPAQALDLGTPALPAHPLPSSLPGSLGVVPAPTTVVGTEASRFNNATSDRYTGRIEAVGAVGPALASYGGTYVFKFRVYHDDLERWSPIAVPVTLHVLAFTGGKWDTVAESVISSVASQDTYAYLAAATVPHGVPINVYLTVPDGAATHTIEYNAARNALIDAGELYASDRMDIIPTYVFA
ncbi:MAG: hypothetical protein ACYDCK_04655 [Thermoplasmatota archaeon]